MMTSEEILRYARYYKRSLLEQEAADQKTRSSNTEENKLSDAKEKTSSDGGTPAAKKMCLQNIAEEQISLEKDESDQAATQKNENDVENVLDGSAKGVYQNSILTHDALLKLFLWLPVEDLISVQYVCRMWEAAAQDKYLWNKYTWNVSTIAAKELQLKIMKMPALRNIKGHAPNNLINMMLIYVRNLRRMNCVFKPSISFSQVRQMQERYPELDSLTLDACSEDFIRSLEILKSNTHLKQLNFYTSRFNSLCLCRCNYVSMLLLLSDKQNFPSLKKLQISESRYGETFGLMAFPFLRDIITNRKQWPSVEVNFLKKSPTIITALHHCQRLQELDFYLLSRTDAIQNLVEVYSLNSSFIMLRNGCPLNDKLFNDSIIRESWNDLRYFCISFSNSNNSNVLSTVIQNSDALQTLLYNDSCFSTGENQLEKISHLSTLHTLNVLGLQCLSEKGVEYVSKCLYLQELRLSTHKVTPKINCYIAEMLRTMENLSTFAFSDGSLQLEFKSREKIQQFLLSC